MTTATIGHNQGPSIEDLDAKPELVFQDEAYFDALSADLQKQIAERSVDMTKVADRDAVRSFAFSIAKRKTAVDKGDAADITASFDRMRR